MRIPSELLNHLESGTEPLLRNLYLFGRRTSLRLEREIWRGLDDICEREAFTINGLCEQLWMAPRKSNLAATVRVFVVAYLTDGKLPCRRDAGS